MWELMSFHKRLKKKKKGNQNIIKDLFILNLIHFPKHLKIRRLHLLSLPQLPSCKKYKLSHRNLCYILKLLSQCLLSFNDFSLKLKFKMKTMQFIQKEKNLYWPSMSEGTIHLIKLLKIMRRYYDKKKIKRYMFTCYIWT